MKKSTHQWTYTTQTHVLQGSVVSLCLSPSSHHGPAFKALCDLHSTLLPHHLPSPLLCPITPGSLPTSGPLHLPCLYLDSFPSQQVQNQVEASEMPRMKTVRRHALSRLNPRPPSHSEPGSLACLTLILLFPRIGSYHLDLASSTPSSEKPP